MAGWEWRTKSQVGATEYTCGYCGKLVASEYGMEALPAGISKSGGVYPESPARAVICPNCEKVTFWEKSVGFTPRPPYGAPLLGLPADVSAVYSELRRAMQVGAYSAAALLCRKIIMHVSVSKGFPAGQTFKQYIEGLEDQHYLGVGNKWLFDRIRTAGNEAAHEIVPVSQEQADKVFLFTHSLLFMVYDLPSRADSRA